MTLTKTRMTEAEFLRMADDGRKYELIDGEAVGVPTSFEHDIIAGNVHLALAPHARGRGYMAIGQAGFRMLSANIRCPDVAFMRKERVPNREALKGFGEMAPDLCVEVISPSQERADIKRKIREYFAAGAQLVWHMLPDTQTVRVFTSPAQSQTYAAEDGITAGDLLPGLRSRIANLFLIE